VFEHVQSFDEMQRNALSVHPQREIERCQRFRKKAKLNEQSPEQINFIGELKKLKTTL
jgi:hypothetical protein